MQKFNEDIQVNGRLSASILDGTLSDATVQPLVDEIFAVRSANAELSEKLDCALSRIEALTQSYNNAIEVINDLAERVAALEANYDPTLIK